jgi:iron(III) transport system permease protein
MTQITLNDGGRQAAGAGRRSSLLKNVPLWLSVLLVTLLFVVPVIRLFYMSFVEEGGMSLAHYRALLSESGTWTMLLNTLFVTAGSTGLSLALGVTTAWLAAYTDIRMKKVLQVLILLPFIIPSYIVTIAWTQLASDVPFADINLYSMGGIIFVLGITHYPLVHLFTANVLRRIPKEQEWAARAGGGGRLTVLRRVTLPLALPGIVGGAMIAFLSNLDNFGIPAFLGIPANITVLSTAIYQEVIGFGPGAFSRAAALSVILAIVALAGTLLQWLLLRKSATDGTAAPDTEPRVSLGKKRPLVEAALWLFVLGTGIVPLLSMLKTSVIRAYGLPFMPVNLTFDHYRYVLFDYGKSFEAMGTSLKLAVAASLICLVFGTAIAYFRTRRPGGAMRYIELSVGLPYALPGIVLGLAMIFAWMEPLPGWNPGIYGTAVILLIAYVTRFMVLQIRGSMTAMAQVSPDMEEAARISGAGAFQKWRKILLPLLSGGILSGALLVLLTSLTELTVSSLLWSSGSETIGIIIFNFEQAGYTTHSTAYSAVVLVLMGAIAGLAHLLLRMWKRRMNTP